MNKAKLLALVAAAAVSALSGCSSPAGDSPAPTDSGQPAVGGQPAATVLSTPTILAVDSATATSLTTHWIAVSGATGYDLFRDTSSSGSFSTKINTSPMTGTKCTDTTAAMVTTYYYKIRATDGTAYSEKSSYASCSTLGSSGVVVYPAPTSFEVTEGDTAISYVGVSWSYSQKVNGFNVYRATTNSGTGTIKLNSSLITKTAYSDSTAEPGTVYFYSVSAEGPMGEGEKTTLKFGYR